MVLETRGRRSLSDQRPEWVQPRENRAAGSARIPSHAVLELCGVGAMMAAFLALAILG